MKICCSKYLWKRHKIFMGLWSPVPVLPLYSSLDLPESNVDWPQPLCKRRVSVLISRCQEPRRDRSFSVTVTFYHSRQLPFALIFRHHFWRGLHLMDISFSGKLSQVEMFFLSPSVSLSFSFILILFELSVCEKISVCECVCSFYSKL